LAGREVLLEATGLTYAVGPRGRRRTILAGADLALRSGELVLLEGESGSGKTTALQLLSGLIVPDSGSIAVAGAPRSARFGVLLQSPEDQIVGATVMEDLGIGGAASAADQREALQRVGLDPTRVGPALPGSLSHGERRRVAWAGLLLQRARIWILDEPTAGVDEAGVECLRTLIEDHTLGGGAAIVAHQDPRLRDWHGSHRTMAVGKIVSKD
jgi:energy-coupling factor transporter ATP-binding protein EcfA2